MQADSNFATNVRIAREHAHLTQGELAKQITFDKPVLQQSIARIEKEDRKVSIGEALAIAEALEVDLLELVEADFAPDPSMYEAMKLLSMPLEEMTPRQRTQYEKAVALLEARADDD